MWEATTICPSPLQADLWPFDLESGVQVTCDVGYTSGPILVFVGLSVLDLGPMYATQTDVRCASLLNAPRGGGITNSDTRNLSTAISYTAHPLIWENITRNINRPTKQKNEHLFRIFVWKQLATLPSLLLPFLSPFLLLLLVFPSHPYRWGSEDGKWQQF